MSQLDIGLQVEETQYQKKIREKFGDWWYNKLKKVINKEVKDVILPRLIIAYKKQTVCPAKNNVFKAYKDTPDPRVLILGQSPYHDRVEQATGRAFECGYVLSPSMNELLKNTKSIDPYKPVLLDSWVNQGVMLLNSRLTVKQGDANSHKKLGWNILIKETLRSLDKPGMVFLLYGSEARSYKKFIKNDDCFIYEDIHPAAKSYNPELEFNGGFDAVNEYFSNRKEQLIDWNVSNIDI